MYVQYNYIIINQKLRAIISVLIDKRSKRRVGIGGGPQRFQQGRSLIPIVIYGHVVLVLPIIVASVISIVVIIIIRIIRIVFTHGYGHVLVNKVASIYCLSIYAPQVPSFNQPFSYSYSSCY